MVVQQSEYTKNIHFKMVNFGTYLVVQWLGFHTSIAGACVWSPVRELRPCMPCDVANKKPTKLKKKWILCYVNCISVKMLKQNRIDVNSSALQHLCTSQGLAEGSRFLYFYFYDHVEKNVSFVTAAWLTVKMFSISSNTELGSGHVLKTANGSLN